MRIVKSPLPQNWEGVFSSCRKAPEPGFKTATEISQETGLSKDSIRRNMNKLVKSGKVVVKDFFNAKASREIPHFKIT